MAQPAPPSHTAHESARALGGLAWVEVSLFEAVGSWALGEPDLEAQAAFVELSASSAWRAEQLLAAMPAPRDLRRDEVLAPPDETAAAIAGSLERLSPGGGSAARLQALAEDALPWLEQAYRSRLGRCGPVADRPVERALQRALADLGMDQVEVGRLRARPPGRRG